MIPKLIVALCIAAVSAAASSVTSADGTRIAYQASGSGSPALVFVHGWSCNRTYWNGQLDQFARHYQVVAVDLAGHGESGSGRKALTIPAYGEDVAAVVEKLDLKRVILIGHSMGGDVIVPAARRLKGRVVGLIWVDTYKKLGTPRTDAQLQDLIAPFRANFAERTRSFVRGMFPAEADPALVEKVAAAMSSAPVDVAIPSLQAAMGFDREVPRILEELKLPVVAMNPESPASDLPSLKRYGVEVIYMPHVGHFMMMENPARFNELLETAIRKIVP